MDHLSSGHATAFHVANNYAYILDKEVYFAERAYQMKMWHRFIKYFSVEETSIAKKHYDFFKKVTTKFLVKKDKFQKYLLNPLLKETNTGKNIEDLNKWLEKYVADCPYDIEACASDLPYFTGSTVKQGPLGSFGFYKADNNSYIFVVKTDTDSIEKFPISPLKCATKDKKYLMNIGKSSFLFKTLGELANRMNQEKIKMIYCLE